MKALSLIRRRAWYALAVMVMALLCFLSVDVLSAQADTLFVPGAQNQNDLPWASDGEANVPYVFHDPAQEGRITGFEYDLMNALGRSLKRQSRFVQNGWDGLIPGLSRGLYAMVIDGIEITPEHQEAVLFSRPYYVTTNRIMVMRGHENLNTLEALTSHSVGTIKNTAAERQLLQHNVANVRSYEEETNLFSDLRNGRVEAVLIDEPIAQYYRSDDMALVGPPIGHIAYGIAFPKDNPELREAVDRALERVIHDGELHHILARWKLWTPQMAAYTGDQTQLTISPIEWEGYRQTMARMSGTTLHALGHRYLTFIPLVVRGAVMTLAVSALAMVLAVAFGLVLALGRYYGAAPVRWIFGAYVEIVRGTPLLIQVLFIFYGLPAFGIRLSPFVAGVLALGLNYAAYEAENYRAGLMSVPRGQMEAAIALNMTHLQALRLVIVPQAFRTVVPVMTNDFIALIKDSSLVSVITLTELSQTYIRLSSTYYDYIGTGLLIGTAYLLVGLPFVRLARMAEKRLGRAIGQGHH